MSKIFIIVREYKSDLIILYRIICTYYNTGEEAKPMIGRGGSLGGTGQSEPDGPFRIIFPDIFSSTCSSICIGASFYHRFVITVIVIVSIIVVVRLSRRRESEGQRARRDRSLRKNAEGG